MNNLKFRVWDKANKEMLKIDFIDFFLEEIRVLENDGSCFSMKFSDVEIMQSTGLFDKSGVEIFEGDIVQYLDGEYSFVGVVENSAFGIYAKNKYDNYRFEDFADENTKEADVVVIGNIYENKELLR